MTVQSRRKMHRKKIHGAPTVAVAVASDNMELLGMALLVAGAEMLVSQDKSDVSRAAWDAHVAVSRLEQAAH
jgi:hypothetical protein